mmetsp:Transcript_63285/g.160597  ORF Transcript_63285/g.160597 Transcript_63285/m.160597 type:complete len:213 (+) Transcript_63285:116-754(+)
MRYKASHPHPTGRLKHDDKQCHLRAFVEEVELERPDTLKVRAYVDSAPSAFSSLPAWRLPLSFCFLLLFVSSEPHKWQNWQLAPLAQPAVWKKAQGLQVPSKWQWEPMLGSSATDGPEGAAAGAGGGALEAARARLPGAMQGGSHGSGTGAACANPNSSRRQALATKPLKEKAVGVPTGVPDALEYALDTGGAEMASASESTACMVPDGVQG